MLDATLWPLPEQRKEASDKRRIGIGFTGLANALAMLNVKYNSSEGLQLGELIATTMRDAAYTASIELSKERGPFPLLNVDKYLEEGTFASRLPDFIKDNIRLHGIRNSHLLSVAPTGTVSLAFADNTSNGIEPPFSLAYTRKKRMADGTTQEYPVVDHSLRVFLATLEQSVADKLLNAICNYETVFEYMGKTTQVTDLLSDSLITALELTPEEHVAMLRMIQPFIDTSISKTVNCPADIDFELFKSIYDDAHKSKLKGISTYRPNSILGSVLSVAKPKEEVKVEAPAAVENAVNDLNNFVLKRPNGTLSSKTKKVEYLSSSYVEDNFYVGVSFLKNTKRPIEVFFTVCPDGVPQEWLDSYAISLSLLARGGLDLFCKTLRALRKVKSDKGQVRYGWYLKQDNTKVPRFHSSEVACMAYAIQEILVEENIIDNLGFPLKQIDLPVNVINKTEDSKESYSFNENKVGFVQGKECLECGAHAVIKKDGCEFCSNCGAVGSCG